MKSDTADQHWNDQWKSIEEDNNFRSNYLNSEDELWTTRLSNETLKSVKLKALTDLVGF